MNGRLDTLQAAVLLAKLDLFDEELARREAIASHYDRRLAGLVQIPARVSDSISAWAIYAVLLSSETERGALQARLRDAGVPTAIYYPRPLHKQPAYAAAHDGAALPVSEDLATRIMALPLHPDLSDAQLDQICDAMADCLSQPRIPAGVAD